LLPEQQLLRCQYLYFCTSKASKLSTPRVRLPLSLVVSVFVLLHQQYLYFTSEASTFVLVKQFTCVPPLPPPTPAPLMLPPPASCGRRGGKPRPQCKPVVYGCKWGGVGGWGEVVQHLVCVCVCACVRGRFVCV
jgi:hypothetical protein